jgi:hypothetical protein
MSEKAAASFAEIEQELAAHIGPQELETLKRILALPWPEALPDQGNS